MQMVLANRRTWAWENAAGLALRFLSWWKACLVAEPVIVEYDLLKFFELAGKIGDSSFGIVIRVV